MYTTDLYIIHICSCSCTEV